MASLFLQTETAKEREREIERGKEGDRLRAIIIQVLRSRRNISLCPIDLLLSFLDKNGPCNPLLNPPYPLPLSLTAALCIDLAAN